MMNFQEQTVYKVKTRLYSELLSLGKHEKEKLKEYHRDIRNKEAELKKAREKMKGFKIDVSNKRRELKYQLLYRNILSSINGTQQELAGQSIPGVQCKKCGSAAVAITPTRMFSGAIVNETRCSLCKTIISVDEI